MVRGSRTMALHLTAPIPGIIPRHSSYIFKLTNLPTSYNPKQFPPAVIPLRCLQKILKRYSMNGHHVLKELCQQLTPLLLHQTCPKSQKTIIDIFVTPNQWIFAQLVYAHHIHKSGFPFLNTDTLTLVAAYEDHQLIAVKEMICSNPNSFNLPDNLLAQIHTLPDVVASPPAWSTE